MAGTAFARARARAGEARECLERDGAVILYGLPPQPDSLVLAAAEVLGTRLSRFYPVRERRSGRDDLIQLHNDSHRVGVDVHGRPWRCVIRTRTTYSSSVCTGRPPATRDSGSS
ncbi:MAG: hypothetical protein ACRDSH_11295 [Pseudonocardiaceae bacterium]